MLSYQTMKSGLRLEETREESQMKMNFQIANCLHPNCPVNIVVFASFEAPDSKSNLHVAMDRYKSEVEALKTLTWRYSHICNNIKITKKFNTKLTI